MEKYRLFDHTADVGCELFGRTRKELFTHAVTALSDLILEQKGDCKRIEKTRKITVCGDDLPDLLVNFLREVLYMFNGKQWVVTGCSPLEVSAKRVVARLSGEPYDLKKHSIKMEIKAVTYHALSIKRVKNGWLARVIFDV